jgi:hypothetical protein
MTSHTVTDGTFLTGPLGGGPVRRASVAGPRPGQEADPSPRGVPGTVRGPSRADAGAWTHVSGDRTATENPQGWNW